MSSDQNIVDRLKPDLEDSTNVMLEHEKVSRNAAAASREQQLRENGLEPVSMWVMIVGFVIAVIGGSVLLSSENFFSYNEYTKNGYIRYEYSSGEKTIPQDLAAEVYMKKGAALYNSCVACHGVDGGGNTGIPPLAGSEWVTGSGAVPALGIIHGIEGPIDVAGKSYNGRMPPMADGWSDVDIASLVYYIQNSFGNNVGFIYSTEQIAEVRAVSKKFGKNYITASDLKKHLTMEFTAPELDPNTMLNLKTGEIIE